MENRKLFETAREKSCLLIVGPRFKLNHLRYNQMLIYIRYDGSHECNCYLFRELFICINETTIKWSFYMFVTIINYSSTRGFNILVFINRLWDMSYKWNYLLSGWRNYDVLSLAPAAPAGFASTTNADVGLPYSHRHKGEFSFANCFCFLLLYWWSFLIV